MIRAIHRIATGLAALFRKKRGEQELDEELRGYLEASVEDKVRGGMSHAQALRAARAEFGSLEAVKDHTRDAGWEAHLEALWCDLRFAARTLVKSPAFAVVAISTLALGIGANSAIFSVVNAIMLRPLPVERPDELISLAVVYQDTVEPVFSYAAYQRFAAEPASGADLLAASSVRRDAIVLDGPPEPVGCKWVSGNYFTVLGVTGSVGRMLAPGDAGSPPGERVAVLNHAYWLRRFGGDASVVGRTFGLRNTVFTIVGVAPPGFFGETTAEAPDLWMPMTAQPGSPPHLWAGHSTTWLGLVGRLRPGVTLAQARSRLEPVYDRVREEVALGTESADFRRSTLESRLAVAEASSGSSRLRGPLSAPLAILMGLVGLVLLIACANVANLMLARAEARRRDTAVCMAIGAGRLRVVRQALGESMWLALAGGLAGLGLAFWGSSILTALVSSALPLSIDATPDRRVIAFTLLVSVAAAFLSGLAPALRAGRVDPLPTLKISGGQGRGAGRTRLRRTLVVVQIAVSLVLLVAAGLFVRSLVKLQTIDMGFDPENVLVLQVTPPTDGRALPVEERRNIFRQLVEKAEAVPGVQAASVSVSALFTGGTWRNVVSVEGFVAPSGTTPRTYANAISPRYFEVMRMRLASGRAFTNADSGSAPRVAVINQTFARQFFGAANPIGRHVGLCTSDPCASPLPGMMEVVGVIADAKYTNLREEQRSMLYVPVAQVEQNPRQLEVRTAGDPSAVAAALHRELAAVDRRVTVVAMLELRQLIAASLLAERLIAKLSAVFGLLALTLAAIGLYGVVAYVTAQRTAEIGIRMALGADRGEVRGLVLRDTLVLVLIGVAIGVPVALAGARVLSQQLYQVTPNDPSAVLLALVTLACAALVAGYLPARRAARLDPLTALRAE